MKWIEVNVGLHENASRRTFLRQDIFPLVNENREKIASWHFLWEDKPWPKIRGRGTTLRLRFYGEDDVMDRLRQEIEKRITELEKNRPDFYLGHCFGRHGDCQKAYKGEAGDWGTKGWELGIKMLQFGSETAMELIRDEDRIGKSDEYTKNITFYADRYVHIFLNSLAWIDEIDFYLKEAVLRIAYSIDKELSKDGLGMLVREIRKRVIEY
jgi:hypothetical protein